MRKSLTLIGCTMMLIGGGVEYYLSQFFFRSRFTPEEAIEKALPQLLMNGFAMLFGIIGLIVVILGLRLQRRTK